MKVSFFVKISGRQIDRIPMIRYSPGSGSQGQIQEMLQGVRKLLKNICSCSYRLKNSVFPVLLRGMDIILRSVAPESGSAATSMNVPDGKALTSTEVSYLQTFSDLHISVFGIGKDPSRDPSGTENTPTIICSGGLLNEPYPCQVTESVRLVF